MNRSTTTIGPPQLGQRHSGWVVGELEGSALVKKIVSRYEKNFHAASSKLWKYCTDGATETFPAPLFQGGNG